MLPPATAPPLLPSATAPMTSLPPATVPLLPPGGQCACCARRSIIYRMKENLLDATKEVVAPGGVDKCLWKKYLNQIRGSGGFDLDEDYYPTGSDHATLTIVKFQKDDLTYENMCKISNQALEWMAAHDHNEKINGYELVDVVKANELKGGGGILFSYFITFKAKNCSDGIVNEFQTEVECRPQIHKDDLFTDRLPPVVKFCRMKNPN